MHRLMGREDFENLLRSLAAELIRQASIQIPNHSWRTIALDVRFDNQGGAIDKIRAETPSGVVSLSMPMEMMLLLLSLDSLRNELLHDRWYGFRMTVNANQQCDVDYNYDEGCSLDPTFYHD